MLLVSSYLDPHSSAFFFFSAKIVKSALLIESKVTKQPSVRQAIDTMNELDFLSIKQFGWGALKSNSAFSTESVIE